MEKKKEHAFLSEKNTPAEQLSAYERWELPSVDDDRPVVDESPFTSKVTYRNKSQPQEPDAEDVDDVKPLTAEELEAIRQAAFEEGKEEGKREGYKEGYDQGFKSGESDLKAAVNKMSQICRALFEPIAQQDDELEETLLQLVESICTRVVHRELKIDSQSVLAIVKEAISCLTPGTERVRIHLNPADAEFVTQALKDAGEMGEGWNFLAHQTISPGGCIVDTDTSVVDMRAEKRLATMIKQVYEKDSKALEALPEKQAGIDQILGEVDRFADDEDEQGTGALDQDPDDQP